MADPDMGQWAYGYDAAGEPGAAGRCAEWDSRTCLNYDLLNRLVGKSYTSSSSNCPPAPTYAVSYGYDAGKNGKGRRTSMVDASGSAAWAYDNRGRPDTGAKGRSAARVGGRSRHPGTYDKLDRVAMVTYPDGEQVTTVYNEQGLAETLTSNLPT